MGPVFFDKKIFEVFLFLVAIATRILHGMEIFELFEEDHLMIIPVKLGEIPPSGLGDVV